MDSPNSASMNVQHLIMIPAHSGENTFKCNPDLCSTELHLAAVEAPSTNGYDFGLTYKFLKVKDG